MENSVFRHALSELSEFLGTPDNLASGNGARFRNGSDYVLTIYHANLADGNLVEIAFKPNSFSQIGAICSLTDHPVKPNTRYNWPRVGLRNIEEISRVIHELRAALA